jgi:hypothetical protein
VAVKSASQHAATIRLLRCDPCLHLVDLQFGVTALVWRAVITAAG